MGVAFGIYYISNLLLVINLSLIFIFVTILIFFLTRKKIHSKKYLSSILNILTLLAIFSIAYTLSFYFNQTSYENHYSNYIQFNKKSALQIKVTNSIVEKKNSYKLIAEVIKVKTKNDAIKTSGKIIIYLEKNKKLENLKLGDVIYTLSNINEIQEAKNPNEFNYKKYLKYQNIHYQTYIKTNYWQQIELNSKISLINRINFFKEKLQKLIYKYIFYEDEQAIASALLLGNRNLLNEDILRAFSSSGATHILAVSGLHVGIFYSIISMLFQWLKKIKHLKYFHPIITISFIWFYVLLTGASPSVMRAATMFSFFAIGKAINNQFSTYNIIALSAIILIAINPYIITEVGFQLSYFAVIGIIYLQPKIYRFFAIKNYLIDKIWAITAVSIAAQISTFPLILLYFHQFPNLFWISNLIVIPSAGIILISGILLFIFSWSVTIATFIGSFLSYVIILLNYCLKLIESIPFALSTGLNISHIQSFLIYLLIIWLSVSISKRSKILFKYSLLLLLLITISFSYKIYQTEKQNILTIYYTPKHAAIEIISANYSFSLIDSSLLKNKTQMLFRIKHNWWEKRIAHYKIIETKTINKNKVFQFKNYRFLLIDSIYSTPVVPFKVDYVIVSHKPKLYLKYFSKKITAKKYIFDSSNHKWQLKYWKKDCKELGLDCYFVSDTTAYIQELN